MNKPRIPRCIFCFKQVEAIAPVEHIWPESFGGPDWAIAAEGTVCPKCNNYFSSKVERQALESFPFKFIRALFGIPTKKGRSSPINIPVGTIIGKPGGGRYRFKPSSNEMDRQLAKGELKTLEMTFSAEPEHKVAVCRLLLKMGLEWMARDNVLKAYSHVYNPARRFARFPKRRSNWAFAVMYDMDILGKALQKGLNPQNEPEGALTIMPFERSEFFLMQFIGIGLLVPLIPVKVRKNPTKLAEIRIYDAII